MTPEIIRSVRAFLGLKQKDFAKEISVSEPTLIRAEMSKGGHISGETERSILSFFKTEGIEITDRGFEKKDNTIQTLRGREGFHALYDQIYRAIRLGHSDLWLYNGVSNLVSEGLGDEFLASHRERMKELEGKFMWRVTVEEGDDAFWGHQYAHYRWISKEYFNDQTIYVYGNKTALVHFGDEIVIHITDGKANSDTQRLFLETFWNTHAHDPDTEKPFRPE